MSRKPQWQVQLRELANLADENAPVQGKGGKEFGAVDRCQISLR